MSIRLKVFCIALLLAALYGGFNVVVQQQVVRPSFQAVEEDDAQRDVLRCLHALSRELEQVETFTSEWAQHEASLHMLQHQEAQRSDSLDTALDNHALDLFLLLDRNGIPKQRWLAPENQEDATAYPEFPITSWGNNHPLLRHAAKEPVLTGMLLTSQGFMLLSVQAVRSDSAQLPAGTLMAGRLLNGDVLQQLQEHTQVPLTIAPVALTSEIPNRETRQPLPLTQAHDFDIQYQSARKLRVSTVVPDLFGRPAFQLTASLPREITRKGDEAVRLSLVWAVLISLTVLLVALVLMRRTLITPLTRLNQHVATISETGELTPVDIAQGKDEIHTLGRGFNAMVERLRHDAEEKERAEAALRRAKEEMILNRHLAQLGEMGASVAHQIRNPLAGISGVMQVMHDGFSPDDERRDITQEALEEVNRVEQTVQQLLRFAQEWQADPESGDLTAFCRQCITTLQKKTAPSGISLIEDESITACFDPHLLEQMLENCIENAVQFLPENGSVTVTVSAVEQEARIAIRDTGPGFTEEALERACEPFFTTRTRGTGLGLAVCQRIMEAHGGRLTLGNCAEGGAEVILHLPLNHGKEPDARSDTDSR